MTVFFVFINSFRKKSVFKKNDNVKIRRLSLHQRPRNEHMKCVTSLAVRWWQHLIVEDFHEQ